MRTFKITIPDDKIDFFEQLMENLGIGSEAIEQISQTSRKSNSPKPKRSKADSVKGDKSLKDVLSKIEQIRNKR